MKKGPKSKFGDVFIFPTPRGVKILDLKLRFILRVQFILRRFVQIRKPLCNGRDVLGVGSLFFVKYAATRSFAIVSLSMAYLLFLLSVRTHCCGPIANRFTNKKRGPDRRPALLSHSLSSHVSFIPQFDD